MSYGVGIFLVVVGAILAFAVQDSIEAVDLTMVGYILMAAGAVGFIIGLALSLRKNKATTATRTSVDPVSGEGVSVTERSVR